jgi:hypothetical protein
MTSSHVSPGSQWEHLIRGELRKQHADFETLTRVYETGVKLEPFYVPVSYTHLTLPTKA